LMAVAVGERTFPSGGASCSGSEDDESPRSKEAKPSAERGAAKQEEGGENGFTIWLLPQVAPPHEALPGSEEATGAAPDTLTNASHVTE
jgi:hypothetical protein